MRLHFPAILLLLALSSCSQPEASPAGKVNYEHPIPYAPRQYVCYRAAGPITIDGQADEASWQAAPWTEDFVDIEGELKPAPTYRTRAKILWDENYLYFAATIEEPHLWATITERDAVMYGNDDFEIFIDPDGDGQLYYEFEMNANNAIWDLLLTQPYRVDTIRPKYINNWDIKGIKTAVHLVGTLNDPSDEDQSWNVEVAMPWSALKEMAPGARMPLPGEQWRINFSRVDWHLDIRDGGYHKKTDPATGQEQRWPEENWVWSPSGRVDMHQVETWGFVQFSEQPAGAGTEEFMKKKEEQVKWALWQLYLQEERYRKQYGAYTDDLSRLTLPIVVMEGYTFQPEAAVTPSQFELIAADPESGQWHINQEGRLWKSL
ncbi:MAG: carbohydrate-binding family 9-like protein [Phaeodactylibacter sp.]|nr:carbohydrate-binding family 9-like protein [Phaeodactylibacter sp.]MCB9302519.1 carbohydrate-binding family 9-like protein [Lewinellaceae bacterium]